MKTLILLNGTSCSGKSTTIQSISQIEKWLFHLSYDKIKWGFSDYIDYKEKYKPTLDLIMLAIAKVVFDTGSLIICDACLYKKNREDLSAIAKKHWYSVLEFNIESEYPVLEKRFIDRLENAKSNPQYLVANNSIERFKDLYELYHKEKNNLAPTLRSDILSTEKITSQIIDAIYWHAS